MMDIGSGSGLLSMFAANVARVKSIHAIECCEVMTKISTQVFEANVRGKMVTLTSKHSKDLIVGEDVPSKVSLVVSETLDCGVFGEGILDTFIHAKQNLLDVEGKIVPWKVKIHVAGYKSRSLCLNQFLIGETFQEYIFLDNLRLVAISDEPYDAEYVNQTIDFKLVTNVVETIEVDFNDLKSMQEHFDGSIVKQFQLQSEVSNDFLDGFVVWFTLYLNEDDETNFISTAPKACSCWPQAIFKLKNRMLMQKYEILKLSMSCRNGCLKIHHEIDSAPENIFLEVAPDIIRFLNDDDYLQELEFTVSQHRTKYTSCLDLSPFPYVGLVLLKDSRLDKLWCRRKDEDLIRKLAVKNVINENRFEFIDDSTFQSSEKFQLIILHPVHPLGDIDSQVICDYPKYREMLEDGGLMVPHEITLHGELINSDWLVDSSRITDIDVKRFKIDKFINKFATEVQLDLDNSLDREKLTAEFKISKIFFDENHHQATVEVPLRNINIPIHAIFYHHKIKITANSTEIVTNRKSKASCFKRSAQVLDRELYVERASVKVSFNQNSGIVKCDVE